MDVKTSFKLRIIQYKFTAYGINPGFEIEALQYEYIYDTPLKPCFCELFYYNRAGNSIESKRYQHLRFGYSLNVWKTP